MKASEFDMLTPFQREVIKLLEHITKAVEAIDPLEE